MCQRRSQCGGSGGRFSGMKWLHISFRISAGILENTPNGEGGESILLSQSSEAGSMMLEKIKMIAILSFHSIHRIERGSQWTSKKGETEPRQLEMVVKIRTSKLRYIYLRDCRLGLTLLSTVL